MWTVPRSLSLPSYIYYWPIVRPLLGTSHCFSPDVLLARLLHSLRSRLSMLGWASFETRACATEPCFAGEGCLRASCCSTCLQMRLWPCLVPFVPVLDPEPVPAPSHAPMPSSVSSSAYGCAYACAGALTCASALYIRILAALDQDGD
eukprot:5499456-Pleurochrysis_carterae.AAC.2